MGDKTGDSKDKIMLKSEIDKELSILVHNKVITNKIALKLGEKLKQKNVKITKKQLIMLVKKIKSVINSNIKSGYSNTPTNLTDTNMQKIVETIEKLDERLSNIESGRIQYKKSPGFVSTDDIDIASWDMNPLLKIPNDPESIVVLMKWLQYLVDKCGHPNLPEILDYYVNIGWISDDAKIEIIDYSTGITDENKKVEDTRNISNLPAKDHIQSLIFIQRLKGKRLDKHFLDRIDGEISRVSKKLDNYTLK